MKNQLTKSIKTTYLTKELDENEKIVEYLLSGGESVKLSDSEKLRMERYFFAHDLIWKKRSRHEVARKLKVKYNISRAQAYRDIYHMQYVVGSSISIDENYYEKFLIDSIIETMRLAGGNKDLKAKAASERNLAMVLGFPRSDDNRITPDMLAKHTFNITSAVVALGLKDIDNIEVKIRNFKKKPKKKTEFEDAEVITEE